MQVFSIGSFYIFVNSFKTEHFVVIF